jgi:ABC-type polysaccharide/polyol phosphate transport system ATPase subunit
MSSNPNTIEFQNVWKKYSRSRIFHRSIREDIVNLLFSPSQLRGDEFWALKELNFTIKAGETVGFYGPNGAGKSTIFKLIANITYPNQGEIKVNGRTAALIEVGAGFHPDLTGRENIFVNGAILGMKIAEIKAKLNQIIEFSELKDFIDMPIKKYSSGMYIRLAFSVAVHSEADIFLFDEIIAVGDQDFKKKCLQRIAKLKADRKTILLVTHDEELMKQLADRIIYLENGQVVKEHSLSS